MDRCGLYLSCVNIEIYGQYKLDHCMIACKMNIPE